MKNKVWGAILLLIGGLVHLIPPLYTLLSDLTGGTAWIQIVVGALSVLVALMMFASKGDSMKPANTGTPGAPGTPAA